MKNLVFIKKFELGMALKIGVIAPTNIKKLSKLTNKSVSFFIDKTKEIGKILAEIDCELWVNSDKGIIFEIAKSYKKNKGKKLVVLYPGKGEPWPNIHTEPYKRYADELRKEKNWFWANYNIIALTDICICAGLSAGVLSELAYIKWNCQLKRGNLRKLIAIKELLRSKKLPPEIEVDIKDKLIYIKRVEQLKKTIKNI
ncbi:MAG: hypothetical protein COU98_02020 [Candidatus Staskawiczbacteria bacterium CG10_big_fil_rev_8_21_14_0_10_38_10]|uniref:Uncharacterized protein n=1 Tax=Candidatus Staskawiczbacteria bacterium CG10_big_fil_rev_8_21_14_0_10_38_10 TaxID=1974891 RepID=A0A2H9T152_9BACT|nr:MAG: hypothetical protein COU98_02020 [Candidatus Staskawiczbacteria bacterium CG10_big_fil_rev_8_21_14_0_10_38_10]